MFYNVKSFCLSNQIIIITLVSFILVNCSNEKAIKDKIETMQSMPINIPVSELMYIAKNESTNSDIYTSSYPFRMIIFFSANECSPCALSMLPKWNEFLKFEDEKKVKFIFIFDSKKSDILYSYHSSIFEHPIMVDTCGVFTKKNPQIPKESMFHTFMLDSIGNVIMVGSPLENNKIRILFEKMINQE